MISVIISLQIFFIVSYFSRKLKTESQKCGNSDGNESLPNGADEMIDDHLVTYVVQVAPSIEAPAAEIRPWPLPPRPST